MNRVVRLCTLLLLCVVLSGCQLLEREKSDKPSPDWSRGLLVGEAYLSTPVGMAVAPDGSRVHLAWSARAGETRVIHYRQLNETATTLVDVDLQLQPGAYKPQLILDSEQRLHMLWLAPLQGVRALYHGRLRPDGQVDGESTLLSTPGDQVESFRVLAHASRGLEVFWTVEGQGGYHQSLSRQGEPLGEATLLLPEAIYLYSQQDLSGKLHLIWDVGRAGVSHDIYYATFDPTTGTLGPETLITRFPEGTGDVLRGPFLGLDPTHGYILWSIEHRSGLSPGTADASYLSFPLSAPATIEAQNLLLPMTTDVPYEPISTPFGERHLMRLPVPRMRVGSAWVESPVPLPGQRPVLMVAATLQVQERLEREVQPIELLMGPEGPQGYTMAGLTDSFSLHPHMLMDEQDNAHLTWLDTAGFGRFRVYYATIAPTTKAVLDTTTAADVAVRTVDLAWGVISSLAFTPIVIVWAVPPLFWLAIFYLTTAEDNLNMPKTKGAFAVSVFLYLLGKFACMPRYLLFVPFYERIPEEWTGAWVTAVPLLILGIAVAMTLLFLRRRDTPSLFVSTAMTILIDAALTILIYTPGFLGLI